MSTALELASDFETWVDDYPQEKISFLPLILLKGILEASASGGGGSNGPDAAVTIAFYSEVLDALIELQEAVAEPVAVSNLPALPAPATAQQVLTTLLTAATFSMADSRSWLNVTWNLTGRSGTVVLRLSGSLAGYHTPIESDISVTTDTGGLFYGGKPGQWQELKITLVSGTLTSIQIDSVTG